MFPTLGFAAGCISEETWRKACEILAASCDDLRAAAAAADGRADGLLGWKPDGAACTHNLECAGDLVCRPTCDAARSCRGTCLALGAHGELCDSGWDCETSLGCTYADFLDVLQCVPTVPLEIYGR